jgi:hypothetical protein
MQLPPFDRSLTSRPPGADGAALATVRVIPVAPVNSLADASANPPPTPGVVNLVGKSPKPEAGERVYTSVADPTRRGVQENTPKDWTIQRPAPEKVEDPPPIPISKVLMDHLETLWAASASAVQVQQQVRNHLETGQTQAASSAQPTSAAIQAVTLASGKVNKNEKI